MPIQSSVCVFSSFFILERSLFMAGGGGRKFRDLLSWGGGGGQLFFSITFGRDDLFFNALFCELFFFRESDITCIIGLTVVGAQ